MSTISRDDIIKLATLGNLKLGEDEIKSLTQDITTILDYVKQLDELDTTDIEPAYQVTGLSNVLRADEIQQGDVTREELLRLAPSQQNNQIKVPKVL